MNGLFAFKIYLLLSDGSVLPLLDASSKRALDAGGRVKCAQHHDRLDRFQRKRGRNIVCNAGQAKNLDLQPFTAGARGFQILA